MFLRPCHSSRASGWTLALTVFLATAAGCNASSSGGGGGGGGQATCAMVEDGVCPATCTFADDGDCPEQAAYYVSPSGDDTNAGDIDHPFKTLEKAHSVVKAGELVYFRAGTYRPRDPTRAVNAFRGRNGEPGKLIRFWAYPGEQVVFDYSTISEKVHSIRAIDFTGDYWHWKGIDVTGTPAYIQDVSFAFMARDSHHCIFERLRFHHNYGCGLALSGSSDDNLVLNCDAYSNQDPIHHFEDANGFMSVTPFGTTNTFRGCRAWWNSDDGFDHFNGNGLVVHEGCWAFWNGYQPEGFLDAGNGMGFKFGGSTEVHYTVTRVATNSLAYRNRSWGFDQNALWDSVRLQSCTAYQNAFGIRMKHTVIIDPDTGATYTPPHIVQNSLSFGNEDGHDVALNPGSTDDHNSWNSGVTVTAEDFLSLDPTGLDGPRKPDGSLPDLDFLKLAPGTDLVDRGLDVGLPFLGAAPDLGAFERE